MNAFEDGVFSALRALRGLFLVVLLGIMTVAFALGIRVVRTSGLAANAVDFANAWLECNTMVTK